MGLHRMSWDFTIVTDAIATYDRWCVGKVVTKEYELNPRLKAFLLASHSIKPSTRPPVAALKTEMRPARGPPSRMRKKCDDA